MPDQAELNALVVANLADLLAAHRQLVEVVSPLVEEGVLRIAADALAARPEWTGEAEDVDELWLAPRAWHHQAGAAGEYLLYYQLRVVAGGEGDGGEAGFLAALTGTGAGKAGLYLVSDVLADAALGKLLAGEAGLMERLQGMGFVLDVADRAGPYVPLAVDRDALASDLRAGGVAAALEPVRQALEVATAAEALLEGMVGRIG